MWKLLRSVRDGVALLYQNALYYWRGAPDGFPIPPRRLRQLVWPDSADLRLYFGNADDFAETFLLSLLAPHGIGIDGLRAILDFGCGSGRVLRLFHRLQQRVPGLRLCGTDINAEQVAWCARNLPFARFDLNGATPPLAYGDEEFDFIYAFGVFSSMSEPHQLLWIKELTRVLRPGGCLYFTTRGEACGAGLSEEDGDRLRAGHLVVYNPEASGVPSDYLNCYTVHPAAYVTGRMAQGLELLAHSAGDPCMGYLDGYLLRKPASR